MGELTECRYKNCLWYKVDTCVIIKTAEKGKDILDIDEFKNLTDILKEDDGKDFYI